MKTEALIQQMNQALSDLTNWYCYLTPEEQNHLLERKLHDVIAQASYVEGYRRIKYTTPMILGAIKAFNDHGQNDNANFWSEHLMEEMGHDFLMYEDLCVIFGGKEKADLILNNQPMSPPSTAMLAYFEWQISKGNPHTLMILRLFLEAFISSMNETTETINNIIGSEGTKTLALHQELDEDHVGPCIGYLEERVDPIDTDSMHWSMDFIKSCLIDAQIWISRRVLSGEMA